MTARSLFDDEEWVKILRAPMCSAMAVTAADPGGLWGALKEGFAVGGAFRDARTSGAGGLVGEVIAAYETSEGRSAARGGLTEEFKGRKPAEIADACVAHVGAAASLVATKAPAEAAAFKGWLAMIAAKVAEAGTEGGFLGFGGVKVSEAEKATLAQIDAALA
jgi:hypothetical protein